ncbi:MAG: SET domain-containing protein-lysine N-methyltransferase [Bacteroidota bacterium]|jgi:hypothetical protein
MNLSLKPHPLVAQWVPGFTLLCVIFFVAYLRCHILFLTVFNELGAPLSIFVAAVIGFVIGQLLDATRDILEDVWDEKYPPAINWRFFFDGDSTKLKNLEEWYFTWYSLDANIAIALILFIPSNILLMINPELRMVGILVMSIVIISFVIFFRDASILRANIKSYISEQTPYEPHYGVYTRIRPSQHDKGGVGVFAIIDIPKGTSIFYGDTEELLWKNEKDIPRQPVEIRKLYDDFCVIENDQYGCPRNFNQMTIAWYLNHSKRPNVVCNKDFDFIANKDVKAGEELTVDYRTYNNFKNLPSYL